MKLSLYQQLVSNGERSHDVFNRDELYSKIIDVKLESTVDISAMGNEILHLLLVREEGCLIYSIQKVNTRAGDYSAFILGIPMPIILSAANDIAAIVGKIDKLHTGREANVAQLESLFEKDYKEQKINVKLPQRSKNYARRTADGVALDTLISTHILQMEYAQYEGVFLVSPAQTRILWSTITDLTNHPLKRPVLVSPPSKSRKDTTKNCTVFLNGEKMTQPVLCHEGDQLQLQLRRENFVDIDMTAQAGKTSEKIILPDNLVWMKLVPRDTFRVICEGDSKENPQGVSIAIKGMDFDERQQCFLVPETQLENVTIVATKQGYEAKTVKNINLNDRNPLAKIEITLKRERKTITYKIKGQNISFEQTRTTQELGSSPLAGYVVDSQKGDTITLRQDTAPLFNSWTHKHDKDSTSLVPVHADDPNDGEPTKKRKKKWVTVSKWRIIAILTGMAIGLIIGYFIGNWHGKWSAEKAAEIEKARQIAEADSIQKVNIVNYLDSTQQWRKTEMDSIFGGKLKGMYDSLNYFNLDNVYWKAEELGIANSMQLLRIDSADKAMIQDSEYYPKVKEITHNEDSTGREFFSKDGTITLNYLFEYLKNAQQQVDEAKKKNQTQTP